MKICLVVQPIHPAGHDVLARAGIRAVDASSADPADVLREIAPASAAITRNKGLSAAAIAAAPDLRVIGIHGVGTDAVAVGEATRRGVVVVNTPGSNDRSVAEHAIALTFAATKLIPRADTAVRAGNQAFKLAARPVELRGRTFGVVGFGNVGRQAAELARAIGMRVVVWSRSLSPEVVSSLGYDAAASLDDLLARSDVISLHAPLTAETRGLIGAREIGLMRSNAILVNTARGALVDEGALADALARRWIAGAGLDVFQDEPLPTASPLATLETVVLSPHIAGSTEEAMERTAVAVAEAIVAVLEGRAPLHPVNRPDLARGPI